MLSKARVVMLIRVSSHTPLSILSRFRGRAVLSSAQAGRRLFHVSSVYNTVKPFPLADVGEGITECQIIQWFVQPGARVEEFDKLCEVQSDKATVEITSPYAGVITKLYYEPDDMAITGKPLLDIDTEDDVEQPDTTSDGNQSSTTNKAEVAAEGDASVATTNGAASQEKSGPSEKSTKTEHIGSLATPAVRHLMKELNLSIDQVRGTGKDGRVLKEDVLKHSREPVGSRTSPPQDDPERSVLSPIQNQMFKTMSKSLSIPHFLYTCSVDMSNISELRKELSADGTTKVTAFAFILKAVSIAFAHHKLLNASLDLAEPDKPVLVFNRSHNFGIAIDTPSGLVVPVIRDVQESSIENIATKLRDISARARENKLSPAEFSGASFTLSNIGAIGGGVVSPVISQPQVAIVGIGKSKIIPAFDSDGQLYKREELILSWSADHRVVDGAECARTAEQVRFLLENPATMMLAMR